MTTTLATKLYKPAIVIVVVFLVIYAVIWIVQFTQTGGDSKIRYPPYTSPCPDYWQNLGNNSCQPIAMQNSQGQPAQNGMKVCTSSDKTYSDEPLAEPQEIHPDRPTEFSGLTNVDKCRWAKKCNVYWEGISDPADGTCSSLA